MKDNLRRNKLGHRLRRLLVSLISRLRRQRQLFGQPLLGQIRILGQVLSSIAVIIIPPASRNSLPTGSAASVQPRVVGAMQTQWYLMPLGELQMANRAT